MSNWKTLARICLLALLVVKAESVCNAEPPQIAQVVGHSSSDQPLKREEMTFIELSAEVKAVDYSKRLLTLKTDKGEEETIKVSDKIKRLNEVKVGDIVVVKYEMSLAMELREPTAEEKANPSAIIEEEEVAKTGPDAAPAASVIRVSHAVVTVQEIDRNARTVTVKGPKGDVKTVKAKDPKNLERLKVGDTIALTFTAALAIELEPGPAKK